MEANPMVRAGPRFSYGSLAIKLGTLGWSLAAQHYILRRNREYMTALAMANIGVAGMLAGVAAHNMHVPAGR